MMKFKVTAGLVLMVFFAFGQNINVSKKYHLVQLNEQVNTGYHEAAPVVSPDGNTIYFFVSNHPDNQFGKEGSQDIWVSNKSESGDWGPAEHLESPLNENHGNQVFTILNNGNTLFIRGGKKRDTKGFSFTHRAGRSWSRPEEVVVEGFDEMNRGKFYGATLSSDGQHLIIYFSENPRLDWSDLYYSKRTGPDNFSRPVKLPANINTGLDEFGPYLAPDDKNLYFASSRRDMGLGSSDLYVTRRLDDTWMNWSKPVNLGSPINTPLFDGYISVDANENIYVAMAGKAIDGGNLDLYHVQPKEISMSLTGIITDLKTGENISANVEVIRDTHADTTVVSSRREGKYETGLRDEGNYQLKVSKEGYLGETATFALKDVFNDTVVVVDVALEPEKQTVRIAGSIFDIKTNEVITNAKVFISREGDEQQFEQGAKNGEFEKVIDYMGNYQVNASATGYMDAGIVIETTEGETLFTGDIYLEPIEVGTTVVLENIYFDFDKTTLKEESFKELNKVVDFMNNNPTIHVEISGHTDSKGSDQYNQDLSQGRAESVVAYIISHGVDQNRMEAKGYGESRPVTTNDTDEGRAENRRVEFTILSK
ncbi:MAG: OmpA family protein [Cyclobacteriaceae bacterium]|nr:OmpA family protein [Cyclobacteriaceae bacterium]